MKVRVKICGLKTAEHVALSAAAGAAYVGFVHYPPSPRHLEIAQIADLARGAPPGLAKVVLVVDPDDVLLDRLADEVPFDMLQVQGSETPARVAEIRARIGLPVMKAMGLRGQADMESLGPYFPVSDQILVEPKPVQGGLPGGNGLSLDWAILANRRWPKPWMLAGGLTPSNVAEAIRISGATQVDVSSGVEKARGEKDEDLIRAFIAAAHRVDR